MKIWRRKARVKLLQQLGGKCVDCGEADPKKLTFDHIVPLSNEQCEHRCRIGANSRMVLYRKEAKENLIEIRCQSCNVKKSKLPKQGTLSFFTPLYPDGVDVPF